MKICNICKQEKLLSEFYSNGKQAGKERHKPMCKQCELEHIKNTRYTRIAVAYGKPLACSICGYDKNVAALDFHHLDPSKKDFSIKEKGRSYSKIESEVAKCICLCSNCHRELHNPKYTGFVPKIKEDSMIAEPTTYVYK